MKNFNLKNRPAFTMIELVFVIVVMGILAAIAIPRLDKDHLQEAADSILSDIRYTQHLALMDNMQEFNDEAWQRKYWRIIFSSNGADQYYIIGSDSDKTGSNNALFTESEAATDPFNGKPMFNTVGTSSDRMFITTKYGITTVAATGGCTGGANGVGGIHIGFDYMGRPHYGFSKSSKPDYASYMSAECILTFTMTDGDTFEISVQPETGYAQIVGQDNS